MALTNEELVWLGRDNSIDLLLYADSTVTDLSAVTEMRLALSGTTIIITSTDSTAGVIKWGESTYATGEIRIAAGGSPQLTTAMAGKKYMGTLVVFDPSNSTGIVWDNDIPLRIMADPLAT